MSDAANLPKQLPRWFQWYMYVVGIGGNLFFYIQAYEVFSRGSANDVSLPAFIVAFWAVASWFAYGIALRNWVLISANIVAMIGSGLVVVGKLVHGM